MSRRSWIAASLVLFLGGLAWETVAEADDAPSPTPPAVDTNPGPNPYDAMPDRVGVVDRHTGERVGTVSKTDLVGNPQEAERATMEVLDDGGKLVGHLVPGVGFVPLVESSAPGYDVSKLRAEYPTTTVVDVVGLGR